MSAVPNINAGNTNAPAMMLGDRCADFVMGLDEIMPASQPTKRRTDRQKQVRQPSA
jgi:choline dehydrogenase-like flavoprotein